MNGKPLLKDKDKRKKERKKTTKQLKVELDKIFSLYVRKKHSKDGYGKCYTCGITKPITDLQCGHFISRVYLATRYSEDNCRPQCVGCNVFGKGKTVEFAAHLERDFDKAFISKLFRQANTITKNFPYKKQIEEYKEKLKLL